MRKEATVAYFNHREIREQELTKATHAVDHKDSHRGAWPHVILTLLRH
jgi:hypothetical protein